MPFQEISHLRQTALLWPMTGYDAYGQPTVGTPIQLTPNVYPNFGVRWNNTQSEMMDAKNNTIRVDATVIVAIDVPIGSWMWLGSFNEWYGHGTGSGSSPIDDHLCEVKVVAKTLDVKARGVHRQLGLMRLENTVGSLLPPVTQPTITPSSASLNYLSTSMMIYGTGFDAVTPGNNVLTFDNGVSGSVTASTTTSLTVTSMTGLSLLSNGTVLHASVTVDGVSSGSPVEVAVVTVPTGGKTGQPILLGLGYQWVYSS